MYVRINGRTPACTSADDSLCKWTDFLDWEKKLRGKSAWQLRGNCQAPFCYALFGSVLGSTSSDGLNRRESAPSPARPTRL